MVKMSTDRPAVSRIKIFRNLIPAMSILMSGVRPTNNQKLEFGNGSENFLFSFSLVDSEWRISEVSAGSIPRWCCEELGNCHDGWRRRLVLLGILW